MDNLIDEFNKGNEHAFRIIFDKFLIGLVEYARRVVKNDQEGEDIVLKCFIKLWNAKGEFKTLDDIKFFMIRLIINESLNYLNSKKHKIEINTIPINENINNVVDKQFNEDSHLKETIINVINTLPSKRREIMILSYIEGMSSKEIGKKLNITSETIATQKRRGIDKIKEILFKIKKRE